MSLNAVFEKKYRGRNWNYRQCGFKGHRDIVGSVNMFPLAFEKKKVFPATVTYLRAGSIKRCKGVKNPCVALSQARSRRVKSPQSCLALAGLQALDHFPGLR